MTIRKIDTYALSLPFEIYGPRPKFAGLDRSMEILLIRVETDSGVVGWGVRLWHLARHARRHPRHGGTACARS